MSETPAAGHAAPRMRSSATTSRGPRLTTRVVEVDALRGLAALSVVLFHYTTRFAELYGTGPLPTVAFPLGHYGVNLFFIISGFVIFMTLERTRRPLDFVVSRFSRLFPAYWVAVPLTFAVTSVFGLPGKEVEALQAVQNLAMIHSLFRVPHVDGVYWTLEVELLFYAGMLGLFMLGRLHRVHLALWLLLALRLLWHVADAGFGVSLSWTVSRLLILSYIPWFALGICVYQVVMQPPADRPRALWPTVAAALACLAVVDGWALAALAAALAALVWAAASGRLPVLGHPVLVFFGAISYTLYLLHENIGWVVQRELQSRGASFDLSIGVALVVAIGLAAALTFAVERPAMRAIRTWYKRRQAAIALRR